jgi:acyl-CoA thioesterase
MGAAKALPDIPIRSIHNLFLRAPAPSAPIQVTVEVVHAGRQLAAAVVRLMQGGRLCTTAQTMHGPAVESVIEHAATMPEVPAPQGLPSATADSPADVRVVGGVDPYELAAGPAPRWEVWSRTGGLPKTAGLPEALVASQANALMVSAAVLPHEGVSMNSAHHELMAVINSSHVVFHGPVTPNGWLLYSQESTFAGDGWVFGRGQAFTDAGTLVASYAEEAMLRALPTGVPQGL